MEPIFSEPLKPETLEPKVWQRFTRSDFLILLVAHGIAFLICWHIQRDFISIFLGKPWLWLGTLCKTLVVGGALSIPIIFFKQLVIQERCAKISAGEFYAIMHFLCWVILSFFFIAFNPYGLFVCIPFILFFGFGNILFLLWLWRPWRHDKSAYCKWLCLYGFLLNALSTIVVSVYVVEVMRVLAGLGDGRP
jgi:hypothetical protein